MPTLCTMLSGTGAVSNPLSASSLFVALSLYISLSLLTNCHPQQPTTLSIDSDAEPDSNSSLQYHLCGPGSGDLVSDTTLLLSGGVHTLQEGPFCLVQNLNNFTIQGWQTQPPRTIIFCRSESETRGGIAFSNISNLYLSHIDIVNCGREVPSGLPGGVNNTFVYLGPLQKAVVIITHSTNVTLDSISIEKSSGFSLLFINPQRKTVIRGVSVSGTNSLGLTGCTHPLPLVRSDMLCAGSGVVIVYSDTITEDLVSNSKASLYILNCSFFNNTNWIPAASLLELLNSLIVAYDTERFLMTGGLSFVVYMGQRGYFVDVNISDTRIFSNAGNVPNFVMLYYNSIHMSTARLEGLTVSDNKVQGVVETSRGGGLTILVVLFFDSLHSLSQSQSDVYDLVEVRHSNFSRNSAFFGGALMFYMTPQNVSNVQVLIRNTTFTDNLADIGSALYAFQFQSLVNSKGFYIFMEDITASGNTYPGAEVLENSRENSGVFLVNHGSNITLVGSKEKGCHFFKNYVSVFTAVRTSVILRGLIAFEDNHGYRGGALSLIDSSILFIHNGSDIAFTRNTAFREGGAIYANTLGSSVTVTCAIQFFAEKRVPINHEDLQLLDLSIVFSNNSARIGGNSIFGNPLYYCLFIPTTSIDYANITGARQAILYRAVFDFQDRVENQLSELTSVEEIVCICPDTAFSRIYCASMYHTLDHQIIPGGKFHIYLNSIDVVGTPVASFLHSFPRSANLSDHVELDVNQEVRRLPGLTTCSSVEFRVFAPENRSLFIDLYAKIGGRKVSVELKTTFCPPGFVLGSSDGTSRLSCLCSEFIETRLGSTCNKTEVTIARPTNYWVGTKTLDNGGYIIQFVSTCPINYCREDVTGIDLRLSDQLCMEGRTGTLCGACRQGLSSVFGTAECRKCSNAWLATLVLLALIGALMVLTAFLLDLTITHGLINGLFFYSNIVMVNANIFFQGNQRGFLFWFLSWVNLDIGFPLCFYDGMTESAKAGLQYVFPTYIILMIAAIIMVSQRSLRMQRIISQLDGIHVLVSMFYISFLKLFRTVIDTFTFVTIVTESEEDKIVWFSNGNQKISDPISIFLILLGSLTLAGFILPYMVFFTFSTYIQRCVNSTRLNAYVDASLAPYKNKLRFWFGARLILTSIIYIIIANRGTNNPTLSLTLELSFLVGFASIQAFIRPFKTIAVAILDFSFLINLIALTLGASYTIQNKNRFGDQETLVNFSLSVVFLSTIGTFLLHLMQKLCKNKRIRGNIIGVVTRLAQALKLGKGRVVLEYMAKMEREEEAGDGGVTGGPEGRNKYATGHSDLEESTSQTQRTTITLQDMIAAPDEGQPQKPSSPQLREPVLEFVEQRIR